MYISESKNYQLQIFEKQNKIKSESKNRMSNK